MKIAMFTDTYFPQVSGVATSIKILADELRKNGHEVMIFTTTDPDAKKHEENIVRIASVPFLFFTDRRVVIGGMHKVYKIAKKEKFDLVHTHTEFGMGLLGKYVANRLNIPLVHTYHTMYEKYLHYIAKGYIVKPSHVKHLSHYFCNHTAGVIAPGKQMQDTLLSYQIEPEVRVIPTGVPVPARQPELRAAMRQQLHLQESDVVLLSLCRLAKEKSLDKLIDALPTILAAEPDAKLVFVGDGPARKELEEQTKRLNLTDAIQFVGEICHDDVYRYYQMADIYVNASETETQGLTYLEALVNGLPLIAKKNDYLSSLVTEQALGMLVADTSLLAQTVIDYIQYLKTNKPDSALMDALLYEISAEKFEKDVVQFYADAQQYYQQKQAKQ